MKIIYLITGLGMGGAESQLMNISDRLQKKGHEIIIINLTGLKGVDIINNDIKIIEKKFSKNIYTFIKNIIEVIELINKEKPNIIHSHMFHANIIARIIRPFIKRKKIICTAHSKNEGGWLRMLVYRLTDFLATITTNVSDEAVSEFIRKKAAPANKIISLPNGLDTNLFRPSLNYRNEIRSYLGLETKKIFLAVGRLTAAKDYFNLIKAFEALCNSQKDCFLIIIGDGELREKIKETINKKRLNTNIRLLGKRSDVYKFYNAADYFVLSSEWEGFGLVVAEAMLTEKIVIATDSGGVSEVMGNTGFLIPTKDSDALYNKMIHVLNLQESESNVIQKKSRQHILENYDIEVITEKWLNLYKTL